VSSKYAGRKVGNGSIWLFAPRLRSGLARSQRSIIPRMAAGNLKRDLLRHFLATIAYRARKTIVGAPKDFADFDAEHGVRTPVEILSHISSVLRHAHSFLVADEATKMQLGAWEEEIDRFSQMLSKLDKSLESGIELRGRTEEELLQGPLADAMTHVGQLAMLRRMASSPIPKEDFDVVPIRLGDVLLT
jgi:hypothetical protein